MTQAWTISYSAVCRSFSCFEQQVAIFSCRRCAWFVLSCARSVWISFKRIYVLSLQKWKISKDMKYPDANLNNRLSWVFTGNYWSVCWQGWIILPVSGNKLPFSELRPWAEAAKRQGLQVIWTGKSLIDAVSTLQPPLFITIIPMKMNLPFCFYLGTSFAETTNLGKVETNLFWTQASRYACLPF